MLPEGPLDILVVDDEYELREQLRMLFARDGHRVEVVADGETALERTIERQFDVVLLDVGLGSGCDGYEVTRRLRERRDQVPIIMLTALDAEADVVAGLEAGADDYVVKPFGPGELRSRIRAVLRRTSLRETSDADILRAGPLVLDRDRREARVDGRVVQLTFSECELLAALMARPGLLLSRQELLRAIWGDSAYRDPRGIDVHVRHLRAKLEPEPQRPQLIVTVRGAGYRLGGT